MADETPPALAAEAPDSREMPDASADLGTAPAESLGGIEQEVRRALDERLKLEGELEVLRRQAVEERARAEELLAERDRLRDDFSRELEDRDRRVVSLQEELGEALLENQDLRARTDSLAVSAEERLRRLASGLESLVLLAQERREQVEALRSELAGEPPGVGQNPLTTPLARLPSGSHTAAADLARASIAAQQAATSQSGTHKTASREELRARASARRESLGLPPIEQAGAVPNGEVAAAPASEAELPPKTAPAKVGTQPPAPAEPHSPTEVAPKTPTEGTTGVLVRDPASRASPAVEAASRASQRLGPVDPEEAAATHDSAPLPPGATPGASPPAQPPAAETPAPAQPPASEAPAPAQPPASEAPALASASPASGPETQRSSGTGSRASVRARRLDADWEVAEGRRKLGKALAVVAAFGGGVVLVVMLGSSLWSQLMPWGRPAEPERSATGSQERGSRRDAARDSRRSPPPSPSSTRRPSRGSSGAPRQSPASPTAPPKPAATAPGGSQVRAEQPAAGSPPEVGDPDETTAAIESALVKVRSAVSQGSIRTATRQLVALVRPQDLGLLCEVISKESDENVRRSLVKAMGKIASKDLAALEEVSEVVRADSAASVRIEGIHVLRNLRHLDSVSLLEELIANERDGAIRIAALGAMRSFGYKQHGQAVMQGFQNESTVAGRVALIKAMGDFGGADERSFLEQVSADTTQPAPVRASASASMSRIKRRLDYQGRAESAQRR